MQYSSYYNSEKSITKDIHPLYKLGDRLFIRKGKSSSLVKERFEDFVVGKKYRSQRQTNDYIEGTGNLKYIPQSSEEYIEASKTDNGRVQLRWIGTTCPMDITFTLGEVYSEMHDDLEENHIAFHVVGMNVAELKTSKQGVDYNLCAHNRNLRSITQNKIEDLYVIFSPEATYYTKSFNLKISNLDGSDHTVTVRFAPVKD